MSLYEEGLFDDDAIAEENHWQAIEQAEEQARRLEELENLNANLYEAFGAWLKGKTLAEKWALWKQLEAGTR